MCAQKYQRILIPASIVGCFVGSTVLLKEYLGGQACHSEQTIHGRTVVITGANTGIGKETAQQLAARGGRIIMACRDLDKCEAARSKIIKDSYNTNVHCRQLDLGSCESIYNFASEFKKTEKRLDILINNAGVMECPNLATKECFEMQLGVNHFGHFLLTNLLLDKLKECPPSRVINLVPRTYERGKINFEDLNSEKSYNPASAYYQSKLAVALFTKELAKRLQGTGVNVYAVNPGTVRTELRRHTSMGRSKLSSVVLGPLWWLAFKTPRQGAQTPLYCAVEPSLADSSGKLYSECKETPWNEAVLDDATARRLWAVSEHWTKLKEYQSEHS